MFDTWPKTIGDGWIDPGGIGREDEHNEDQDEQKQEVQQNE